VEGISLPIITIAYLFFVDWRMALVALIPFPIAALLFMIMIGGPEYKKLIRKYHDSLEKMNATIVEYIRGMPVVKIFNQTATSFSRFKDSVYAYRDFTVVWAKKGTPPWAAFRVITGISLFFLLPFGTWFYLKGTIDLPALLLCLMLGSGYMIPLVKLASMGSLLSRINEGVSRIDKIFSEPEIPVPDTPKISENYDIEFKNVSFSYGEKEVLHDISFKVKEGTTPPASIYVEDKPDAGSSSLFDTNFVFIPHYFNCSDTSPLPTPTLQIHSHLLRLHLRPLHLPHPQRHQLRL